MQVEKAALKLALAATLCAAGAVVSLGAQSSAGARTYTPPRTAWGDPDLQGIWPSTDMVGVPFERPSSSAARVEVSDKEFARAGAEAGRGNARSPTATKPGRPRSATGG